MWWILGIVFGVGLGLLVASILLMVLGAIWELLMNILDGIFGIFS